MTEKRRSPVDRRRATRGGRRAGDPSITGRVASRPSLATVLLVDAAVIRTFGEALETAGCCVLSTASDDAAVVAAHRQPDVIVLDPCATGAGWQLCVELQRTCPDIPVVLVAAAATTAHIRRPGDRALTNCAAIIATPCDGASLASVILRVCHDGPGERAPGSGERSGT